MPESRPEQIAEAIVARLREQRTGDWYPASKVVRHHNPGEALDDSLEVIYVLSQDGKTEEEEATGQILARMRMGLTLIKRFTPGSEDPFKGDEPTRWTIQERMEQDVRRHLRADSAGALECTLGDLCDNLELLESEEGPEETYVPGWAVAFMLLQATYHYGFDAP